MVREPLLYMNNVTKCYQDNPVIDHFHLMLQRGELVALYGPNGAGKSTLIKMIAGLVPPTSGIITVNGLQVQKNRKRYAQEISYMPDYFQFQQKLTVTEFLMFYAKLRGFPKEKALERVLGTIEKVGLLGKKDAYISTLSKGMGQRLLLAQTLFSEASLFLFDEPTNGLDDEWLEKLQEQLFILKAENKTVLFSTHLHQFATSVSDSVIHMVPCKET